MEIQDSNPHGHSSPALGRLIQDHPNINITVSGQDLLEFGETLVAKASVSLLQKQEDKLKTPAEVEDMLSICPATRWRWDKNGILKGHRIGRRLYYHESEIRDLLKKRGGNLDE